MASTICTNFADEATRPIDSLEDLLEWQESSVDRCLIGNPLSDVSAIGDGRKRPRTLVCHDMAGGYLEDRFAHGCVAESVYYFREWPYVDVFVYFSHHFVTIPPVGWINAAHVHNVPVLGTFITEWTGGEKICEEFLTDSTKLLNLVDKLARIAAVYKFDGWLLNIENPITHVENLISFVGLLTAKCKETIGPNSLVIWYDSVTVEGNLKWQDALNDLNKRFFDVSDGIFLNYGWNEEKLATSVANAGDRLLDVYVGLDVFGRGCMGGGGYKSFQALNCIRERGFSAAIFAPGWVFERLDKEQFEANQRTYWSLLAPGLHCKKIVRLPFSTSFIPGKRWYPPKVALSGPNVARCFFCLRDQELQPHWFCPRERNWPTDSTEQQPAVATTNGAPSTAITNDQAPIFPPCELTHLVHEYTSAYPAGSILRTATKERDSVIRLFCCDLTLDRPIRVSTTYQAKSNESMIGVALTTRRANDGSITAYSMPHTLDADRIRTLFDPAARIQLCQTAVSQIRPDIRTIVADIEIPNDETLRSIDLLVLSTTSAPADCSLFEFSMAPYWSSMMMK